MNFIEITVSSNKVLVNISSIKTIVSVGEQSNVYCIGDDKDLFMQAQESRSEIEGLIRQAGGQVCRDGEPPNGL